MGGLARRVSYIKAFKYRSTFEVPTLFVDAGNLFTDDRAHTGQLPTEVMTKNKWVVKSYGDFRHDAANLTTQDLPYLSTLLKKEGFDERVEELPFIKRLISANIKPIDDSRNSPTPYVIREIALKRGNPGQKIRVGIVGFTEGFSPNTPVTEALHGGFRIDDPFAEAKRILPELKAKTDFIIALAYMPQDKAQVLATENPEIDTLIGARQINATTEVQHFNRATIAYAYNETKYLGELRMYVRPDGSIEKQMNRFVALDSTVPDDPVAQQTVTTAHTEFTNQQSQSANTLSQLQPPGLINTAASPFVGVETCANCHVQEHAIWQKTGHAHAMATLENKNQQFDNECVSCHVVGFNKGGFQSLTTTPQFANVQCESCHGPGRQHAQNPGKGYGFMATPVGCTQCHTQPNSPDFNFETYWPQVAHGKGLALSGRARQ